MRWILLIAAVSGVTLLGCVDDDTPSTEEAMGPTEAAAPAETSPITPAPMSTPTPQPPPGTTITVANSQFGDILFDSAGQAIYLFDKEETSQPECYDECAIAWPPVLTRSTPVVAGAADPAAIGTTTRTDGSTQVTYAGHPLYYYAHEGKNQVLCHDVSEFGGLWLVVTPSGAAAATT